MAELYGRQEQPLPSFASLDTIIDAIKFYYQGNEIGEWDHIFLNDTIYRYE